MIQHSIGAKAAVYWSEQTKWTPEVPILIDWCQEPYWLLNKCNISLKEGQMKNLPPFCVLNAFLFSLIVKKKRQKGFSTWGFMTLVKTWIFSFLLGVYSNAKQSNFIPHLSLASLQPSFEGFLFHLCSLPLAVTLKVSLPRYSCLPGTSFSFYSACPLKHAISRELRKATAQTWHIVPKQFASVIKHSIITFLAGVVITLEQSHWHSRPSTIWRYLMFLVRFLIPLLHMLQSNQTYAFSLLHAFALVLSVPSARPAAPHPLCLSESSWSQIARV